MSGSISANIPVGFRGGRIILARLPKGKTPREASIMFWSSEGASRRNTSRTIPQFPDSKAELILALQTIGETIVLFTDSEELRGNPHFGPYSTTVTLPKITEYALAITAIKDTPSVNKILDRKKTNSSSPGRFTKKEAAIIIRETGPYIMDEYSFRNILFADKRIFLPREKFWPPGNNNQLTTYWEYGTKNLRDSNQKQLVLVHLLTPEETYRAPFMGHP